MTSFRRTPPPQVHKSMGLAMQATPSSASASKPGPARLPKVRMSKLSPVANVKPLGQVDREAAVERRELGDRQRPVLSQDVAGKVQAEHAGGGLGEIAGDRFGRREPQPPLVGHGSIAAVDGDIVAERGIAAGEGQVPIADRDRAACPTAERLAGPADDGDARLIVDLDIADDLAAVGDGADRRGRSGAQNSVAGSPARGAASALAAVDRPAVGQRRDRARIRNPRAARAADEATAPDAVAAVAAADRSFVGQRLDRARIRDPRAALGPEIGRCLRFRR